MRNIKPCIKRYFSAECARLKSSYSVVYYEQGGCYLVIEFKNAEASQETPDEDVMSISARIIEKNLEAYKKLAQ